MERKLEAIFTDRELRPAFYDQFHCLMGGCRISCCWDWRIGFNKKDYLAMKHLRCSPELAARMKKGLRRIHKEKISENYYAEFNMDGGACPMLREDGLCALQIEKGAGVLPNVCQTYPRNETYTPFGYLERGLSPSCEAVLALLWELPEGIDFISEPLPKEKRQLRNFYTDTAFDSADLQRIRTACIAILQDRSYPLLQRTLLLGAALKELADGETDLQHWEAKIRAFSSEPVRDFFDRLRGEDHRAATVKSLLNNIYILITARDRSQASRDLQRDIAAALGLPEAAGPVSSLRGLLDTALPAHLAAKARFQQQFGDRAYFMENLMVEVFFYLHMPEVRSLQEMWKSYVNFCNLCSFYHFMAYMSCREGSPADRNELFRMLVHAARRLLHNRSRVTALRDELFQHDNASLADMAVLLSI